jgi:hypothetical protein
MQTKSAATSGARTLWGVALASGRGLARDEGDEQFVDAACVLVARLQTLLGVELSAQALAASCGPESLGDPAQRGSVGVYLKGNTVVDVVPGSPAASCGMKQGDKIIKVDGALVDANSVSNSLLGDQNSVAVVEVQRRKSLASSSQIVSSLMVTPFDNVLPETHILRLWRQAPHLALSGLSATVVGGGQREKEEVTGKGDGLENLLKKVQADSLHLLAQLENHLRRGQPFNPPHMSDSKSGGSQVPVLMRRVAQLEASLKEARHSLAQAELLVKRLAHETAGAMLESRRAFALHARLGTLKDIENEVRAFAAGSDSSEGGQEDRDSTADGHVSKGNHALPITLFSSRSPLSRPTIQLPGDFGIAQDEDSEAERRPDILEGARREDLNSRRSKLGAATPMAAWPHPWSSENNGRSLELNADALGSESAQDVTDALALLEDRLQLVHASHQLMLPPAHSAQTPHPRQALYSRIAEATLVAETLCRDLGRVLVEADTGPGADARAVVSAEPAASLSSAVQHTLFRPHAFARNKPSSDLHHAGAAKLSEELVIGSELTKGACVSFSEGYVAEILKAGSGHAHYSLIGVSGIVSAIGADKLKCHVSSLPSPSSSSHRLHFPAHTCQISADKRC